MSGVGGQWAQPPDIQYPEWTCLVQRGLSDGVLLNEEAVLVREEQLEDPGQGGGGNLELEHAVVSLPLHAAWEVALEELLDRIQIRKQVVLWGFNFHCDNVAVSKPGRCTQCTVLSELRQSPKSTFIRHNGDSMPTALTFHAHLKLGAKNMFGMFLEV